MKQFKGKVTRKFEDLGFIFQKDEVFTFWEPDSDTSFYHYGIYVIPKTHVEIMRNNKSENS